MSLSGAMAVGDTEHPHVLRYDQPATKWTEALPIGNGRLGAMVYGKPKFERIALNEDTLYAGEPTPVGVPPIDEHVDAVFELVKAGRYTEADRLVFQKMTGRLHQSYATLGNLRLTMTHDDEVVDYHRELDLGCAVTRVAYRVEDATYVREVFVSAPDQVIVVRITCDKRESVSFAATMDTPHRFARLGTPSADTMSLTAKLPLYASKRDVQAIKRQRDEHKYPELFMPDDTLREDIDRAGAGVFYARTENGPGMTFEARLQAVPDGGAVRLDEKGLHVQGADAVTLLLAADSSFNGYDKSPSREGVDPSTMCRRDFAAAAARSFAELRTNHVADYRRLFERVTIDLGPATTTHLPTDKKIERLAESQDPHLAATLFQFGRYLLISSSRPGCQPANLQGVWSHTVRAPWNGAFHLDINLAMNYWPAHVAGVTECAEPLVDYLERLAANGRRTAERSYGCRGWVAHMATSIWCNTDPLDLSPMTVWNMGGAWLCQNLWDHYAFGCDRRFLAERAYPLLKGASEFYLDWLREDETGRLFTPVSLSPENRFHTEDGQVAAVSTASTMDLAIIRELFGHTIHAARILRKDTELRETLRSTLDRLPPYRVGRHGQLQEWQKDWDRTDDRHRHLSHLWPAFPGTQIDPTRTPKLAEAVARSLEIRGPGDLEFSLAWRMALWSRLGQPERAYDAAVQLMRHNLNPNLTTRCYPNKPEPFESDGNFGFTAGVAEMLLHSRLDLIDEREIAELHLLPALPEAWPNGSVHGLRARGDFEVDMTWEKGCLAEATVRSDAGTTCCVRSEWPLQITAEDRSIKADTFEPGVIHFDTRRNVSYTLRPKGDLPAQIPASRAQETNSESDDERQHFRMLPGRHLVLDDQIVEPGKGWFSTVAFTDYAVRSIEEAVHDGKPFFGYVAYFAPHYPLQALPLDIDHYRGRYTQGWEPLRAARYRRQIELGIIPKNWKLSPPAPGTPDWSEVVDKQETDLRMAVYAAMVDEIDVGVGRIVDTLGRQRVLDNTLVIFLSDNGACPTGGPLGGTMNHRGDPTAPTGTPDSYVTYGSSWANACNTPFRRFKAEVHEGGIITPLILHWPARIADRGAIRRQIGHVIDLMPTCLDVAGASYPDNLDEQAIVPLEGVSLIPAIDDKPIERGPLYFEHMGNRAVRDGKWKAVAPHGQPWELYDLEADGTETRNLAEQHADRVQHMKRMYQQWADRCQVVPWSRLPKARSQTPKKKR